MNNKVPSKVTLLLSLCIITYYHDVRYMLNTYSECKDGTQEKPSISPVVQGHMQSLDQGERLCL